MKYHHPTQNHQHIYTLSFIDYIHDATHLLTLLTHISYNIYIYMYIHELLTLKNTCIRITNPETLVVNSGAFFYFLLHIHIIHIKKKFLFPAK
jgi:hypothetical protein